MDLSGVDFESRCEAVWTEAANVEGTDAWRRWTASRSLQPRSPPMPAAGMAPSQGVS